MQKFLRKILPQDKFQEIEEESKQWFIECPQCRFSISYWEAGGVRAFAASWKKKILGRCPRCKKMKFLNVIKKKVSHE